MILEAPEEEEDVGPRRGGVDQSTQTIGNYYRSQKTPTLKRTHCTHLPLQVTHVKPSPDAWGAACYAKAGWSPGLAAEQRKAEGSGAAATDWRREWSAPSSGRSAGACRTESGGPGDQTTTWGLSEESSAGVPVLTLP